MQAGDANAVLDRNQLRDVTMDDPELMREILDALISDTSRQLVLLEAAIRDRNAPQCARLAHYSKGACANVGASRAAGMFKRIEHSAANGAFGDCVTSLAHLVREVELLRNESTAL